eukprot:PhM_4_TR2892/c0_g1_i1/m.101635
MSSSPAHSSSRSNSSRAASQGGKSPSQNTLSSRDNSYDGDRLSNNNKNHINSNRMNASFEKRDGDDHDDDDDEFEVNFEEESPEPSVNGSSVNSSRYRKDHDQQSGNHTTPRQLGLGATPTPHHHATLASPPHHSNKSLFLFTTRNKFRRVCARTVKHRYFTRFILFAIALNSITLGLDQPGVTNPRWLDDTLRITEIVFTVVFTLEMVLKVVSYGFVLHRGAYLRSGWNVMDFVIVVLSIVAITGSVQNVSMLRLFRVLRPLRSVNSLPQLRQLVTCLLRSMPMVLDNVLLLIFLLLIFAIGGVQLWAGDLHQRCYVASVNESWWGAVAGVSMPTTRLLPLPSIYLGDDRHCGGAHMCRADFFSDLPTTSDIYTNLTRRWSSNGTMASNTSSTEISGAGFSVQCAVHTNVYKASHMNFDYVWSAMLLVLKVMSLDGWQDDMKNTMDASGIWAFLFYVWLTMLGSFFCINLFLAILTKEYTDTAKRFQEEEEIKAQQQQRQRQLGNATRSSLVTVGDLLSITSPLPQAAVPDSDDDTVDDESEGEEEMQPSVVVGEPPHVTICGPANTEDSDDERHFSFGDFSLCSNNEIVPTNDYYYGDSGSDDGAAEDGDDGEVPVAFPGMDDYMPTRRHRIKPKSTTKGVEVTAMGFDDEENAAGSAEAQKPKKRAFLDLSSSSDESGDDDGMYNEDDEELTMSMLPPVSSRPMPGDPLYVESEGSGVRYRARVLMGHPYSEHFFLVATMLSVLCLSIDHYGSDSQLEFILDIVNITLTSLFILESILKLVGFGKNCFRDKFTVADFLIVLASIPDLAFSTSTGLVAFRAFRLIRVLRLARRWSSLQVLLKMLLESFSSVMYLALLVGLFIYIFAILGMQIFGGKFPEDTRPRFASLWESAIACFIVVTGDGWTDIMRHGMDVNAGVNKLLQAEVSISTTITRPVTPGQVDVSFSGVSNPTAAPGASDLRSEGSSTSSEATTNKNTGEGGEEDPKGVLRRRCSSIKEMQSLRRLSHSDKDHSLDKKFSRRKTRAAGGGGNDNLGFTSVGAQLQNAVFDAIAVSSERYKAHGTALGLFSRKNKFRKLCGKIVTTLHFELAVLFCTVISSVFVGATASGVEPKIETAMNTVNSVISVLFIIEFSMKLVAFGAWKKAHRDHVPYFRDPFNRIDAIVTLMGFLAFFVGVFKMFVVLRVVRLAMRFEQLRVVSIALMRSLPHVARGTCLCLFVFLIFGILGVQLFKGVFYHCTDEAVLDEKECTGMYARTVEDSASYLSYDSVLERKWVREDRNFDNIVEAMLVLFQMGTGDAWSETLWRGVDTSDIGTGPKHNARPLASLYFVIFYILGNFFALNIILGLLINYFTRLKKEQDGFVLLTDKQREYINCKKLIDAAIFQHHPEPPVNRLRRLCYIIVFGSRRTLLREQRRDHKQRRSTSRASISQDQATGDGGEQQHPKQPKDSKDLLPDRDDDASSLFDRFITVCILSNAIVLAMHHYNIETTFGNVLTSINMIFTFIFGLEAVIKILAVGKDYFYDSWNRFDFIVTVATFVGLFIGVGSGASVVRLLRVGRLLRLIRRARGLNKLFTTLVQALPAVGNVVAMLLATFYCFAVVGVYLFKDTKIVEPLSDHQNFRSLPSAALVLYGISTNSMWTEVMEACNLSPPLCDASIPGHCGSPYAPVYFVMFMLCGSFVMLQLLIAIVLETFTEVDNSESHMGLVRIFGELKEEWARTFGPRTTRIPCRVFFKFLRRIPTALTGLGRYPTDGATLLLLYECMIPVTRDLSVQYRDVVYGFAFRAFDIDMEKAAILSRFNGPKVRPGVFTASHVYAAHLLGRWWRLSKARKAERRAGAR